MQEIGNGGLSGRPIQELSTQILKSIHSKTSLPLIGVGGIDSEKAAMQKIQAGASLIQVYSGLVYQGPGLIKRIKKGLVQTS